MPASQLEMTRSIFHQCLRAALLSVGGAAVALACSSSGTGGPGGGQQSGGCHGSCIPGQSCTISPPPGSKAPEISCTCRADGQWCCDRCAPLDGGTGGSGGAGGAGGSGGGTGGQACTGACDEEGAECWIHPPPGSDAPSIQCLCSSELEWCCDGSCGSSGGIPEGLGKPCANGNCPEGLEAVTYCGFAGCDNGMLCSCEIRCDKTDTVCPEGTVCASVADGPGEVCVRT